MITPSAARRYPLRSALTLVAVATLAACGGGSGDDSSGDAPDDVAPPGGAPISGGDPIDVDTPPAGPPPGDIARYGVLNLGDDGTAATELVAGFFALPTPVAAAAFGNAVDPAAPECDVVPVGDDTGFAFPSAGFLPAPSGVPTSSIAPADAGETLLLTSAATGTWAELQPASIGGIVFYDPSEMLPEGPVPTDLVLDVPGGDFPAFSAVALPDVTPLVGFDDDSNGAIGVGTGFTWQPSANPNARVRLSASSNFFADPSTAVQVFCTVADTGTFTFDADTREALGEGFAGERGAASRITIATASEGDALLILVRESESAAQ